MMHVRRMALAAYELHKENEELKRENERYKEALEDIAHNKKVAFWELAPEIAKKALGDQKSYG